MRDRECSRLKDQHERLERMRTERERLKAEGGTVDRVRRATSKDGPGSSGAGGINGGGRALGRRCRCSRRWRGHCRTQGTRSTQPPAVSTRVQRARGVEDLGRKIDELGRQTQSLEAEYRRATNQELPADLEARIGNIEQVTRELRRGSAASRQGWFGQVVRRLSLMSEVAASERGGSGANPSGRRASRCYPRRSKVLSAQRCSVPKSGASGRCVPPICE